MVSQEPRLALDNCIKCSICVTHCPVARVTDKFAGPKQNGPDLERFRLEEPMAVHPSIEYCNNCKSCDVACTSGVNISAMNCKAKGEYVAQRGAPLRDRLLARAELMGNASRLAPSLVNLLSSTKLLRKIGAKLMGVSADMTLPSYAKKAFLGSYKPKKIDMVKDKVVYYPGCYVNYNKPEVGLALVDVLNHNGIEVAVDKFNCCGLPAIANGIFDIAKEYAYRNIEKLQNYVGCGYHIVTSCPSCNLTLRQEYKEILGVDTKGINKNIFDVFEYLQYLVERGQLDTNFKSLPQRMGYHQPCHFKAMGCGVPSLEILRLIPELKVVDLDAGCCGLSGSYGLKEDKYLISQEIGQNVGRAVKQLGVNQVLSECCMCQLQIQHLTGAVAYHPIQVLAGVHIKE